MTFNPGDKVIFISYNSTPERYKKYDLYGIVKQERKHMLYCDFYTKNHTFLEENQWYIWRFQKMSLNPVQDKIVYLWNKSKWGKHCEQIS